MVVAEHNTKAKVQASFHSFTAFITGFQAKSKDQEILEEGGGAGPSS